MAKKTTKKKAAPAKGGAKKRVPAARMGSFEINAPALLKALEAHVLGGAEMTPGQVSAALALLKLQGGMADAPDSKGALSHEEALAALG